MPRPTRWLLAAGLLATLSTAPAQERAGTKVGEKAPPFTLKDQSGKERSLDDFLKKGPTALVFHRSAGW